MYSILQHAHSGLRWLVLVFLIMAIFNALTKRVSGSWTPSDKKKTLFGMMFTHIQIILGIVLYAISPKVSMHEGWMKEAIYRFYGMEHITMMLIAAVVITIGYSTSKRAKTDKSKFTKILIFYTLGLVIILSAIPWPFREALGGGWF